MKTIRTISIAAITALLLAPFASYAASVSARGSTLDAAEAIIASKAKEAGAQCYKITSARFNNGVYMTAELYK
ncbi:DUF1471 domain-containing protein [Erwinia sp. OLTSP20]|uniref:DUF1471 domain-containing protein n=1 Tax=unclassified Erwinia TaxID=2622719 RepID=UPI000C1A71A1|nr:MULTISPECIES: DUF1471 domain-containing protein [unclassified Erwinia]PIJ50165.1 DUF1471 domain-containing protein [Erwinia sp. OAMSP11]PIJ71930.1 DUF1471 domain-containing protein [Erwinia sp. OLSSP12]PIJ81132.1 DUF1471 domain-containing protein [Erwinia sp. OLCASP19]PIJ83562.1 DUF1471 domain-containing protein [Erwinia sp. OLMTSP26]PIJ86177.1 DUF1471 domain-containing protein [Erwinia sp. OLMDSP33]